MTVNSPTASPAPARLAFAWLLALAVAGFLLATYLLVLPAVSLMQGGAAFGRFCTAGGHFDCFTVSASKYGVLFGLPLSAWGMLLYAVIALLALVGLAGERALAAPILAGIGCLAFFGVLVDAYLAWVMVAKIRYLCSICLATYAVNGLLFVSAMVAGRGHQVTSWRRLSQLRGLVPGAAWPQIFQTPPSPLAPLAQALFLASLALAASATLAGTWLTQRMTVTDPVVMRQKLVEYLQAHPPVSVDTTDDPALGPQSAPVTLVEFSDFLCPSCQVFFASHRILRANEPDRVRFIFKHYPLESSCNPYVQGSVHPGACRVAVAAECAQRQGQFWAWYDRVFEETRRPGAPPLNAQQFDALATQAGLNLAAWRPCLDDPTAVQAVRRDIEAAHQLGVTSTPTLFINGVVFAGALPPQALEELVRLLGGAASAVPRAAGK